MFIEGHEHDGVRRWAITYWTDATRCTKLTLYSDAVSLAGALAHLGREAGDNVGAVIRSIDPDTWLDR